MADESKFGQMPGSSSGGGLRCEEWEALLTDALDGLLPAGQAAAFAAHGESCENCGDLLAHVKQGQEWLGYLHAEPEIPSGLVAKILEKTVGAGAVPLPVVAAASAGGGVVAVAMPWRRSFHETRLLMTVAMAFFSLALTLNLVTGGHLTTLRLADLKPSQIGNTLSREFYGAQKSVVQYYHNLRFVYELESRTRELRRDVESAPANGNAPSGTQQQQQKQGGKGGSANAGQSTGLLAELGAGSRELGVGQRSAFGVPRSEEQPSEIDVQKSEAGQTTEVVLKSVKTGSAISLGHSKAGLRRGKVERGLV